MASKAKKARSATQTLMSRIASDPALKAKYLSNPGLRSKLPSSALTPELRRKRETNTRLNAPIVPGSTTTGRELSQIVTSAGAEKYGEVEADAARGVGRAEGLARDQVGWYDEYLRKLAAASANQQAIGAQAVDAQGALMNSIRGLDQGQAQQMQQAAGADAAVRGTQAADLSGVASGASTARQALAASFGSTQTGVNAANSGLANTRANVVGPGQKLQARAQGARGVTEARAKLSDVKRARGAFETGTRAQTISDELKNILAQQALGLDASKAQASATSDARRLAETTRTNRVRESATERRLRLESERVDIARAKANKPPAKPAAVTAAHDRRVAANTKIRAQITTAADDASYRMTQQIDVLGADGKPTGKKRKLNQTEIRADLRRKYKDADIANAAIELAFDGYVHPTTVAHLQARGIGVPKAWRTRPPASQTTAGHKVTDAVLAGAVTGAVK